jgi:thiamine biosynthesis lipoprotein
MKETRLLMGMPITVEIADADAERDEIERVFAYFSHIDELFSTYKETSEISRINRGEVRPEEYSAEVRTILALSEETKRETSGYFDIRRDGLYDPSGIVKGWSIQNAAQMLRERGEHNFYIDAGGDIAVAGRKDGNPWRVGIRNPFNRAENVKVLALSERGIATSGTAIRGQHIYNPHDPETPLLEVASLTVIGPNVYEADRFATAAFAMGRRGIYFIEQLDGFEGYMIDVGARATMTTGFERYVLREP